MPAVHRGILRFLAQLDDFAQERARGGIVLLELPADPCEAIPSPYGSIIWVAKTIRAARAREAMRHGLRCSVRFAYDENHFPCGLKSRDFTTNLWSPHSRTRSVTVAILVSTMASCSRSDVAHWSTVPGLSSRGPESSCTPISGAIMGRRMATSWSRSTRRKTNINGSCVLRAEITPHSKSTIPAMKAFRIQK